jgi:hypothetical protein
MTNICLKIIAVTFIIIAISCATTKISSDNTKPKHQKTPEISNIFRKSFKETPDNFIKKDIPESFLLLNSVIKFSKRFPEKILADNITDFAISDNQLIFMIDNYIVTTNNKCNKILLDKKYSLLQFKYPYILAYNEDSFEVLNIRKCGSVLKKIEQYNKIKLIPPYIYFMQDNSLFSVNFVKNRRILNNKFDKSIMFVGGSKNFVFIVDSEGNFILLDIKEKLPIYKNNLQENIVKWNSIGFNFYGITEENKLMNYKLIWKNNKFSLEKDFIAQSDVNYNCILSSNSIHMFCNEKLFGNKIFEIKKNFTKIAINNNILYGLSNNVLYILKIDKKEYVKSLELNKVKHNFCVKDNTLYFKDFDKIVKAYNPAKQIIKVTNFPENCQKNYKIKNETITLPDNSSYKFGNFIKSSKHTALYKRIINNDIYFYYKMIN